MIVSGKKGSSKGGGSSGGHESPNTLRSKVIARIVELLGEGEIVGLVDVNGNPVEGSGQVGTADSSGGDATVVGIGGSAIFFDQTQAQGNDGSVIFHGLTWEQRTGTPDQAFLNGNTQSETPISVETQVKNALGPVTRTITDPNIDQVRVVARIPALALADSNGNIGFNSVQYHIDVRPSGGAWTTVVTESIVNQKCTSPWNRAHLITLPANGAPWDIRMVRDTGDSTDNVKNQNDTYWESYTEITTGKFIYPDSALVSLQVDASQFGTSMPARAYRVKGLKTDVPSNYDPVTRTYTGIWDGTFKKAWHNNPAWVFYDLLVNGRYGLGEFIDASIVDKWGLYAIARYCDGQVPSGFFDPQGNKIFEPRFVFNGVINSRKEAYKVLQDISAAFRGMAYWSLGQVFASADLPQDPITTISPANVIGGAFKYSGTSMKARHSVALVTWYDPADFFRPAVEVVQNDAMLLRFGWRETQINAIGCTSRGQAHRYGKWILDTEQNETETVEFAMSWDGFVQDGGQTLKPGDIIFVADPRKAGSVRIGGRLKSGTAASVNIDFPFQPAAGATYTLNVVLPDGTLQSRPIGSFTNDNITLNLSAPLSQAPTPGAMWSISGTDVNPRRYRIMAVTETENQFKISGLFSDPTKYARIEDGIYLDPVQYTRPKNTVQPVSNINAHEDRFIQDGVFHSRVSMSWTAPADFNVVKYHVTGQGPYGFDDFGTTIIPGVNLDDLAQGNWVFQISSVNRFGLPSSPVGYAMNVQGWSSLTQPTVMNLVLVNAEPGNIFNTPAPSIAWTNEFPANTPAYAADNIVRVYDADTNALVRTERIHAQTYTYSFDKNHADGGPRRHLKFSVTIATATGESDPATITVTNPQPAAITPAIDTSAASFADVSFAHPPADYAGAMVWVSQDANFVPVVNINGSGFGNTLYDGPDTKITVGCPGGGIFYIWIGLYDVFGKVGMNISARQTITVTSVDAAMKKAAQDVLGLNGTASIPTMDQLEDVSGIIASVMTDMMKQKDDTENYIQKSRQELSVAADGMSAKLVDEKWARLGADYAEAVARQTLEVSLNTAIGQTNALVITEQQARVTGDTAEASNRLALEAKVNTNKSSSDAALISEQSVRSTADSAEANNRLALEAKVDNNKSSADASILSEQTARATADTAEANARLQLDSKVNSNKAATDASILSEQTTRATADTAEANARLQLEAKVDTNKTTTDASIVSESSARATADTAEANARTALEAKVDNNNTVVSASIATEQSARASADSANATSISQVQTTVAGNTASISTVQSSVNGIKVQYGVTGTIDGVTGGFLFQGVKSLDGTVSFALELLGNLIVNGSITGDKIAANQIAAIHMTANVINAGNMITDNIIVTGHIVNNAVTQLWSGVQTSNLTPNGGIAVTFNFTPTTGTVLIHAEIDINLTRTSLGNPPGQQNINVLLDGAVAISRVFAFVCLGQSGSPGTGNMSFGSIGSLHLITELSVTPGVTHSVQLQCPDVNGLGITGYYGNGAIVVQELKR